LSTGGTLPRAATSITYWPDDLWLNPAGPKNRRRVPMSIRDRHMTNHVAKILTSPEGQTATQHSLFAACPIPAVILGRDGVIQSANPAALVLFRCGTTEIEGGLLGALVPELARDHSVTTAVTHSRAAVRRPDGHNFIARVQLAPLAAEGPLLVTFEDLSEYEQEIAATHKELESFMSAAGHDLRGPLRILKGFTDALDDECAASLNDEGRTFLAEILKAADRMEGLIDGLLALSRAGRAEMTCENLDLSTLIDLVLYELRHEKKTHPVHVEVQPGLNAWGDVRLVMVVLRNLLGNAWKFTARAVDPCIRVHAEERDGHAWICITDNGAGFDMAHAERLFQPFTRLHRQDEFPGHGLGLATVRRIVKRHGGEVDIFAAPEQGASVRFRLGPAPQD
jgi:signal transduction histidine kinase